MDNMAEMLIDYLRLIHFNCIESERLAQAISLRCKYRIGEQIIEMKEDGMLERGRPKIVDDNDHYIPVSSVKLTDLGITKDQSSNYQAIAAIPRKSQTLKNYQFCINGLKASV